MANKFTYQVLRDTTTDSVIKLTGTFDANVQEFNPTRIAANSLSNALATNGYLVANATSQYANTPLSYYDLQLTGLKYFVNMPVSSSGSGTQGTVEIFWNGAGATPSAQYANSATIFHLNSSGDFGMGEQLPSIINNSGNGVSANVGNGDIGIMTNGSAANCSYTMIVSLRKNNAMYQRGQFNDPAAFNAPPYNLKP